MRDHRMGPKRKRTDSDRNGGRPKSNDKNHFSKYYFSWINEIRDWEYSTPSGQTKIGKTFVRIRK
jgi:hypothetical protein